ncbi:3248_t:CDS:1, partial [Acaulospora colombiana]
MTEANSKSVIDEAIVKDNISQADMANAILSQELRECIETVTKSLTEQQNTIGLISNIRRQVLDKKIWISLYQLLEIVKPEVRQELINSIANPDIPQRNHTPCKAKRKCKARKKLIFNDTASESSSLSGSDSESSNDDEDFTVNVVK